MNTIPVKRDELLAKLEENKTKHNTDFETALAEWVRACTAALEKAAETAVGEGRITENPLKDLPKPRRFSKEYEDAIERVTWFQGETVELDDRQFAAWVQDNWDWTHGWVANSTQYLAAASAR
jgi:hypothetical protein